MSLKGIRKSDGTAEYIYADDTLSEENAPGEAKAAGDRIAGVEGRVTTLETAAPEIISNATKDWLDDNVTPTGSAVAIDSSLTQSGLAADAKAAGDAVNDLKSDLDTVNDTIDGITDAVYEDKSGTRTAGKFINYNAVVVDANQSFYIETYDVTEGDRLLIGGTAGNGGYGYIITDENGNVLDKPERNTTGGLFSFSDVSVLVPSEATHLIISSNSSTTYTQASCRRLASYIITGMSELSDRITVMEGILDDTEKAIEVQDTDYIVHNDRMMYTGGSESAETALWLYVEYTIPSIANGLIITAMSGQSARRWVLKDANGTVVGYSDYSGSPTIATETVDLSNYPTAKTIYVNDKKSDAIAIAYTYIAKVVNGEDVYINGETLPSVLSNKNDKLQGKILCCCGDSITYGADMDSDGIVNISPIDVYQSNGSGDFTKQESGFLKTWGWQIAERHNMTFYNAGVSGSTIQAITDRNGFSIENGRYTKLPSNIDYLLLWFGWNDNAAGTLGTINDNTNESYYGAFNVVLPYLINKYPYTKIGLIVPFGTTEGHRNAVRQLGDKWGVAVWDNYKGGTPLYFGKEASVGVEESVVTANRAKFQANGAHPNFKGHKQLGDMIEAWLETI